MSAHVQFDMFKETTDDDVTRAELSALKESHNAVRKKTFALISELTKMYLRQQEELDYLKCKMGLCCIVSTKEQNEQSTKQKKQKA